MKFAKTVSTEIINGIRIIKTKFGKNIVETSSAVNPFGSDGIPPSGFVAILSETISNEDPIVIGYLNTAAYDSLNPGDSINYSTDAKGALKAYIIQRNDGTIEMLGDADNMVRYSKLETAYNELQGKVNDLITAFNSHLHPTAAVGPPSPPTPVPGVIPATTSAGEIAPSKIDEIKTT